VRAPRAQTVGAKFDDVIIAVRDLEASKGDYSGLGFSMNEGGHPGGTQNSAAHFSGGRAEDCSSYTGNDHHAGQQGTSGRTLLDNFVSRRTSC
jgi:hypothetical protein